MNITVSIAVITGRDKKNLDRFLDSINKSTNKPDELIIVYDMANCDFDTSLVGKDENGIKISSFEYYGNSKQPAMRNIALKNCDSDYIWFVDDDVSIHSHSLNNLKLLLEDLAGRDEIGCIAGNIIEHKDFDRSKIKKPIEFYPIKGPVGLFDIEDENFPLYMYESITGKSGKKYPIIDFAQGTSMVYSVPALNLLNGFDESLGIGYASYEDSEVGLALRKKNFKTVYSSMFPLTHHKLPRVSGVGRGNGDFTYNKYLMRNHVIAVLKNGYPTCPKSIFYAFSFCVLQMIRCIKANMQGESNFLNYLKIPLISFVYGGDGIVSGIASIFKSKFKRINSAGE